MSASAASPTPASAYRPPRIKPLVALKAIRQLIANPDDTAKVFDVIDALAGRSGEAAFERFRRSEQGQRLLEERPQLVEVLMDRERLMALPEGTLGRTYAEFVTREQISADGLVGASEEGGSDPDPNYPEDRRWFGERLRDMHDLWHVTTGYNRDLVGEASLLAFTYAQIGNRGIGFIVAAAYWKAGSEHPAAREHMREGYRRGKAAAWLPEQDWEALLARPLDQVRADLGLGDPPVYEEFRSEGAPELATA